MDVLRAKDIFRQHLRKGGQRCTPEREEILEAILASSRHFSAESLVKELRRKKCRVSLATIYRTIPVLVQCRLVQPTVKVEGVEFFERNPGEGHHHDHLLCLSCGKIVEFCNPVIEDEQEKTAARFGFVLSSHSLELKGLCPRCRQ